jgi:cob(I)alamin adenosyltransferase
VSRRAERRAWTLLEADPLRTNALTAKYLNRLSDLLFILSRVANPDGDVKWVPGGSRSE